MRLVIVGHNSFIASSIREPACMNTLKVLALTHDADLSVIARGDRVVNCALHPNFCANAYRIEADIDLCVAQIAIRAKANVTMLSTRRACPLERAGIQFGGLERDNLWKKQGPEREYSLGCHWR